MHILLISNLFPPEVIGGAEKHAFDDAIYLANYGHQVSVITTGTSQSIFSFSYKKHMGVDIHRVRPVNMYSPYKHQEEKYWKKPVQHIIDQWNPHLYIISLHKMREIDPDIIHIHNYSGLSKSIFSSADAIDVPIIHTLHDYNALHIRPSLFSDNKIINPGPIMDMYQKYTNYIISNNTDMILSPSRFVIDKHHEEGVFTDVATERVPLGIDTDDLNQYDGETTDSNVQRLLYVGQLTHSKGVDILIDAVQQIDEDDVELHILGKGPERESLEARAESDDRIKFYGFVSEEELARQYTIADFTIVPSRWYDNSPMVIYESYARQTPVIGANIGGIPELIDEDETGYCFEPERPDDLATVITAHRGDSTRLSENLNDVDVSLDTHVNRLLDIYNSLLE